MTKEWFEHAEFRHGDVVNRPGRPLGRPRKDQPKRAINLRVDPDVLAHFRAGGPGWQTRMNEALRRAAGL